MLKKINSGDMGKSNLGWLNSTFHFSFADYYNRKNMNFGVLRVINDDLILANTGFDTHPHKDMEIVSYVVDGALTHADSMGNTRTLSKGHVQYMSAGTGITHSEFNKGDSLLRLLQIWILPDKSGHKPNYGDHEFELIERKNKWLHIVSGMDSNAPIKVNQDVNFYVLELDQYNEISFSVDKKRQAYLVQIEGSSMVNRISLKAKDALEIYEEKITIKAESKSNYILIEMNK